MFYLSLCRHVTLNLENKFYINHSLVKFNYSVLLKPYVIFSGMTGIILTLIVIVMYVFAMPYARRNLFRAFWITHSFYILLYIFLIMHGLGRLVQPPLTHYYLLGPLVLFVLDKLFSLSRNQILIDVKQAEVLPSGIYLLRLPLIMLKFVIKKIIKCETALECKLYND